MELLLKHGAYVSIPDFEGDPPLHWAVRCGHVEIAQFLLDKVIYTHPHASILTLTQ